MATRQDRWMSLGRFHDIRLVDANPVDRQNIFVPFLVFTIFVIHHRGESRWIENVKYYMVIFCQNNAGRINTEQICFKKNDGEILKQFCPVLYF